MKSKIDRGPDYQKERSERQQARILDALTDGPKTAWCLADVLHLSKGTVYRHLREMMKKPSRRVYVCGYEPGDGYPRIIYDIGDYRNVSVSTYQKRRLVAGLAEIGAAASVTQLAARVGLRYGSAISYMRKLRHANRVYVAAWEWVDRTPQPLYLAGQGEDAPKPTSKPKTAQRRLSSCPSVFAALGL